MAEHKVVRPFVGSENGQRVIRTIKNEQTNLILFLDSILSA